MIKVNNVSMKFNLGIEKNFSLKQFFIDLLKRKKKKKNEFWALNLFKWCCFRLYQKFYR